MRGTTARFGDRILQLPRLRPCRTASPLPAGWNFGFARGGKAAEV